MVNFELHYEVKARMSLEDDWMVITVCSDAEILEQALVKHRATWRYVIWDSFRAAKRK